MSKPKTEFADWLGWLRVGRGEWQVVGAGATSAEAGRLVDDYLAGLDNAQHAEVYVGRKGNRPPMAGG